jgi:hypothetical protein
MYGGVDVSERRMRDDPLRCNPARFGVKVRDDPFIQRDGRSSV